VIYWFSKVAFHQRLIQQCTVVETSVVFLLLKLNVISGFEFQFFSSFFYFGQNSAISLSRLVLRPCVEDKAGSAALRSAAAALYEEVCDRGADGGGAHTSRSGGPPPGQSAETLLGEKRALAAVTLMAGGGESPVLYVCP
jgi:hypothetical protein